MSRTLSNTKRRPGQHGDFGKETPPLTGTTANIHMWLAAWHMDHGHSVADTDQFVDTLRKLDWTATKLRNLSMEKLIDDLHTCDYKFDWAPRLAGDIKRAINLKDFNTFSEDKTPFRDLPDLIILPNRHFIDNTPPATATTSEVRDWLKLWFNNRPDDQGFKLFTTRFEYQCPLSLIDELQWDGIDIVFFTQPDLKKTILGKFLRGAHNNVLAADIREGRKKMRKDLAKGEFKRLKTQFSKRSNSSV